MSFTFCKLESHFSHFHNTYRVLNAFILKIIIDTNIGNLAWIFTSLIKIRIIKAC